VLRTPRRDLGEEIGELGVAGRSAADRIVAITLPAASITEMRSASRALPSIVTPSEM
jgi:hypothetical protein